MNRGLVIIPTYNERENIESIIREVLKQNIPVDVLVVDDNSPDGTGDIVRRLQKRDGRIHLIERSGKLGLGTAYIEGFKWAIKSGYDFVFEMDADFSHNPNDLPRVYHALNDFDLVIGSRYIRGIRVENWPLSRKLLSYSANLFARFVTGVPVRDLTAGFKGIRSSVLKKLDLEKIKADGYGFQIEVHYYTYWNGFRVKEIPIVFVDRRAGKSKMSKQIIKEAFQVVILLGIKRFMRWK
ncbi:MAG TPA: polyprenol monophosphomannose synthase [candidate division WOR-3 bacterium]|uniref:Polyprenol monophosphomannose synthase n=1 Tax=candidate division WOR-3 bacterium TaxID=2052148 RepID=A0A7C0VA53_UNCW3|nr:polyprenol monophosphomannose synthase [candidate division WOR-3 bacterium]